MDNNGTRFVIIDPIITGGVCWAAWKIHPALGMAVQTEAANGRTGTDGDTMHLTGIGVPFALVSIPLRYMHNPCEVGSLKDIQDCIDLLSEFFASCTEDMDLKPF